MSGSLSIKLRGRQYFTVFGGPFRDRPANMKGVKLAVEIDKPCDISIPTKDFSVPDKQQLREGLIKTIDLILAGEPVYAGCMGGVGRTGLFLALLVKSFGGTRNCIKYVRENYNSHAVETKDQHQFVMKFSIPRLVKRKIRRARLMSYLTFWRTRLTVIPSEKIVCKFGHTKPTELCSSCANLGLVPAPK